MNHLGVISALLALVAFPMAHRAVRNRPVRTRVLLLIPAIIAALPGAGFAVYYLHVFPEAAWYYQFRSLTGSELLVVFLGVAGGMMASLLPRLLFILPLLGVMAFSIAPIIKPFIGPLPNGRMKDKWDGDICLQSTPSTCGAASTATILKHHGVAATEAELVAEAHSYARGTEAWYLARAARSRGFKVDFDFHPGFSPEGGLPAVVGVRLGNIGHFIPILGMEEGRFIVGDPLVGRELLLPDELHERYIFTGFHMRIKK